MPASVADPIASVLRTALSGKKGPFSHDAENGPDLLEDRLAASAKRVLLTEIDYEPAPNQQLLSLDSLKSKYIVLNGTGPISGKVFSLNGSTPITQQEVLAPPKVTLFRSEDVQVGWKNSVPVGAGMINMGNTCYMNSTLQALFHVPSLANWLLDGKHCTDCDQNGTQQCTICAVSKTLQSTHTKSGSVVKPILIYNRLKLICKHMVHGRQEDAHEFMRYLIESMEKAYLQNVGGTKLDSRSKETNPLGQIFGGYIRTEVTCLKCKHVSTTFQHFQDIPLDIQHASTLEDALSYYFRRERLEGENAYKCDKCKSKVPATKKFSIEKAPNVLCIQLKRFGLLGGKMSKHIQFSRQIHLNRFLSNPQQNTVAYKFVSLINHMGPSQHCGHYTAIAEASNGQLYLFDDCSVRSISLNLAMGTGAYILIYERLLSSTTQTNIALQPKPSQTTLSSVNNIPTKVIGPKPAMICESRSKISFQISRSDGNQKPRLVIHNGDKPLFKNVVSLNGDHAQVKSVVPNPPTNGSSKVSSLQIAPRVATPQSAVAVAATAITATAVPKSVAALVPYDSESDEEEEPASSLASSTTVNGRASNSLLTITGTKWQVSQSPTPSENTSTTSTNGTCSKWQVSESVQHDSSSSSTTSSNCNRNRWVVRSLSDTESETVKVRRKEQQQQQQSQQECHSDTEMDPPTKKNTPALKKLGNTIRQLTEKILGPRNHKTSVKATSPKSEEATVVEKVTGCETSKENPSSQFPVKVKSPDDPQVTIPAPSESDKTQRSFDSAAKTPSHKWDGSRTNDTVKELLKMSHSGYDEQIRTWDGGKSHVTKQVEQDKRMQRKRTADELYDEEFDQGKVKKMKTKDSKDNRELSPNRSTCNPFQQFQNFRNRDRDRPHYYKSNYYNGSSNSSGTNNNNEKNNNSKGNVRKNRHHHGYRGKHRPDHRGHHRHHFKTNSWRGYR